MVTFYTKLSAQESKLRLRRRKTWTAGPKLPDGHALRDGSRRLRSASLFEPMGSGPRQAVPRLTRPGRPALVVVAGGERRSVRERRECRLLFLDRLPDGVQDKQKVARRRNPPEQVHLREHLELATFHLMAGE